MVLYLIQVRRVLSRHVPDHRRRYGDRRHAEEAGRAGPRDLSPRREPVHERRRGQPQALQLRQGGRHQDDFG